MSQHQAARTKPKQILHDAHKAHPLVLRDTGNGFRCDGCLCSGVGFRYRCDACNFNLHEFCATCPPAAPFPFHGQHPLTFEPAVYDQRWCDLCGVSIERMHYRCRPCGFDVHPICSQLPGAAVSPLHPDHLVMLTVAGPRNRKCTYCEVNCQWHYRCSPCGVSLHPKCLLGTDKTPLGIPKDKEAKTTRP